MLLRTCLVMLLLPATATAQTISSPKAPPSDISLGLAVLNESQVTSIAPQLSVTGRMSPRVGFVGNLEFYPERVRCSGCSRTVWAGGVRIYRPGTKASPFGQFTVGITPFAEFAMFPGVGVEAPIGRRTAFRGVLEFKIAGDEKWFFGNRVSVGFVMKLGSG